MQGPFVRNSRTVLAGKLLNQAVTAMFRTLKNQKGQSMVEFAMILPILLLILLGVVEFGRFYNAWLMVTHASREGARMASLGGTTLQVEERVDAVMASFDTSRVTVTINPSGVKSRGDMVTITVNYDIDPLTPMFGAITGGTLHLGSDTVMRVE